MLSATPSAAHADTDAPPPLTDGNGLTQVPTERAIADNNTGTAFVITVTTPQVANDPGTTGHHIKILLPADYAANPTKRYPVLYLLHGVGGNPIEASSYAALQNPTSMIEVIPDGGTRGWYTNWLYQTTAAGAQNWENFHINQVIPFIDANLRTIPDRAHRAIAGISMGGFGAFHYAQNHQGLFSQTASLSGAIDLSRDAMDVRMAAVGTLTNVGGVCGSSSPVCQLSFGPTVSSDALFGTPYLFSIYYPYSDTLWNSADPSTHMAKMAGMGISIYVGNGNGDPSSMEFWAESASKHVKDHLDALKMPYHYVDYGNGAGWGSCDGGHDGLCWAQDLQDWIPRLEQAFAAA
ncbi:alpha/beta hydrolase-fold protein [Streptomyces sp. MUM 2J]|uniref:alpha/beta hydrolase n=1 Tax=Streptomyces sp. MUM 2J TaxID=2791987 RepID=UPI001F04ADE2|nr:esterase [Streptomyces sp. MUM 2J]